MTRLTTIILIAVTVAQVAAQTVDVEPAPRLIRIVRRDIELATIDTERKAGIKHRRALEKARWPTDHRVWSTAAGPSQQWSVTPFDSYRSWARDHEAQKSRGDAAAHPRSTTMVAALRDDLSYQQHGLTAKVMSVTIVTTKPGHAGDYVAERRLVRAAHERAGTKEHYSVYQVTAGMPTGTFLMFLPYDHLGELDGVDGLHGAPYNDALGDEGRRRSRELSATGIAESTVLLLSLDGDLTYTAPRGR